MDRVIERYCNKQRETELARQTLAGVVKGMRQRKEPAKESEKTKQELHCHGCNGYVQFEIDISWDGNYAINCPKCGHAHYRVVKNGHITEERWASSGASSGVVWQTVTSTYSSATTATAMDNRFYWGNIASTSSYYSTTAT